MPMTLQERDVLDEQMLEHPLPTKREQFKAALARRYSPRMHMSLILMACGLSSMVTSWALLHAGVHSMVVRYPIAITLAYAVFLLGVWTWLRAMGYIGGDGTPKNSRKSSGNGLDIDIPSGGGGGGGGSGGSCIGVPRGGGGSFDGGGASASFSDGRVPVVANLQAQGAGAPAQVASSSGKSGGFDLGGIDGDGIMLLILALALALTVFICSGYLIWSAPDVLTEAAFGAALTGTLARPSAAHAADGWVAGVVKKTWWPFAGVLLVATIFAGYAAAHFPEAHTFRQAIAMAVAS